MPPAKNPSRSAHPSTYKKPAALKWLSSSLDAAEQALVWWVGTHIVKMRFQVFFP
jgi:hypothetical protein